MRDEDLSSRVLEERQPLPFQSLIERDHRLVVDGAEDLLVHRGRVERQDHERHGQRAAGSALTMALVILAFDTAPVHKKVFGAIDYKAMVPFNQGLERKWLAFFQYSTGQIFVTHSPNTG